MRQKYPLSAHLETKMHSFWGCQSFFGVPRGCRYSISVVIFFKKFGQKWWGCRGCWECQDGVELIFIPDFELMDWRRHCRYVLDSGLVHVRGIITYIYIVLHVPITFHFVQTKLHVLFLIHPVRTADGFSAWLLRPPCCNSMGISFNTSYLTLRVPTNNYQWTNRGMSSNSD